MTNKLFKKNKRLFVSKNDKGGEFTIQRTGRIISVFQDALPNDMTNFSEALAFNVEDIPEVIRVLKELS